LITVGLYRGGGGGGGGATPPPPPPPPHAPSRLIKPDLGRRAEVGERAFECAVRRFLLGGRPPSTTSAGDFCTGGKLACVPVRTACAQSKPLSLCSAGPLVMGTFIKAVCKGALGCWDA